MPTNLSLREVAGKLGITYSEAYKLITSGALHSTRTEEGQIQVEAAELARFQAQGATPAGQQPWDKTETPAAAPPDPEVVAAIQPEDVSGTPLPYKFVGDKKRYQLEAFISHGGYGEVFRAVDTRFDSKVAIKRLTRPQAKEAFNREAKLLNRLKHTNLPRVIDHFEEYSQAYLVMDYIEGLNLAKWLEQENRPVPEKQALAWADTLLDILNYLHRQKPWPVVHRDIKPANIILQKDTGTLFLVDFGIAKDGSQSVAARSEHFSPPEQIAGNSQTTPRSDIYGLGATLYTLLSYRLPPDAMQRKLGGTELARPNHVSLETWQIIQRAMALEPENRWPTAEAMRQAFKTPKRSTEAPAKGATGPTK